MNPCTEAVIRWALSTPVLTKWLAEIAEEGTDELLCTVVDLLDPGRNHFATAFLKAVGAPLTEADVVWQELCEGDALPNRWTAEVQWDAVRQMLLAEHQLRCAALCRAPCP